jgi:hypothetical protein
MEMRYGAGPPRPDGIGSPLNDRAQRSWESARPEQVNRNNSAWAYNLALTETQAFALRQLRRQRLVAIIVGLGSRPVYELLTELDHHHSLGEDLDDRLRKYAALDPALLRAVGADRFPASPMRAVTR